MEQSFGDRNVAKKFNIFTGQQFETVKQGIDFYRAYAIVVGFDGKNNTMRKNRDG